MGVRIGAPSFLIKIRRTSLVSYYSRCGLRYERLQVIRKIPARDQAGGACLRELASQLPRRHIDNRVRIMAVDRVDGSWGVIDSNDFNLFTRSFRKLFRKEDRKSVV